MLFSFLSAIAMRSKTALPVIAALPLAKSDAPGSSSLLHRYCIPQSV